MGQDKVIHSLRAQKLASRPGHRQCLGQFQLSDQGCITGDREAPISLPSQAWAGRFFALKFPKMER